MVRLGSSLVVQPTSYWRIAYSGPDSARFRDLALRDVGVHLPPNLGHGVPAVIRHVVYYFVQWGCIGLAGQHLSFHPPFKPSGPSRTLPRNVKGPEAIDKAARLREAPCLDTTLTPQ